MLKCTIAISQGTSDLVKLRNNKELTAKDIKKSITVIKSCTEAMPFLDHANQEADSTRRINIAVSLPEDLYSLAQEVQIPLEWLFGDYINVTINNVKAHQKAFKVDQTYFKQEGEFDRQAYFPKKLNKSGRDFPKYTNINTRGTKKNLQNRHTRKQGISLESKYKDT